MKNIRTIALYFVVLVFSVKTTDAEDDDDDDMKKFIPTAPYTCEGKPIQHIDDIDEARMACDKEIENGKHPDGHMGILCDAICVAKKMKIFDNHGLVNWTGLDYRFDHMMPWASDRLKPQVFDKCASYADDIDWRPKMDPICATYLLFWSCAWSEGLQICNTKIDPKLFGYEASDENAYGNNKKKAAKKAPAKPPKKN